MVRVYGEPVEVQADDDGRPARFAWRGRLYTVRSIVEHWVVNREWWREPDPIAVPPGLEFWRVEAAAAKGSSKGSSKGTGAGAAAGTYELRRDMAAGAWTLQRVQD